MLRRHQREAIEQIRASVRGGMRKVVLAAPCSFGKTRVAMEILKATAQNGKTGRFICDRIKLIDQALAEFDAAGIPVGVMQGDHWRANFRAPIQIASIQTLSRRMYQPPFDVAIVDECHTHYQHLTKLMARNAIFIGLSATPFTKGLGNHYDDVVVPITPRELLAKKFLTPVKYYGGVHADLTGVKSRRLSTGGKEFDPKSLGAATEDAKLVGDVVRNFQRLGRGQTIAFSPTIKTSRALVQMFNAAGISAEHIDGYMEAEEREIIYESHDAGDFQVLSCSQLLNTGYDAPKVQTLIDLKPTQSLIAFVQRAGRIMRTHPNKDYSVYLDHAGNIERHGFPEDIVPNTLDLGEKEFRERDLLKEKKEPELSVCPECYQHYVVRCVCGYQRPSREKIESDDQDLKEILRTEKRQWLGELQLIAKNKGYQSGWAAHAYRKKFNVWPRVQPAEVNEVSAEVLRYVKHLQIRRAKSAGRHFAKAV